MLAYDKRGVGASQGVYPRDFGNDAESVLRILAIDAAAALDRLREESGVDPAQVGFFGLLVALYSGIGWMSSLRDALTEQWAQVPEAPVIYKRIPFDLLALGGLGVALAGSFALTTFVTRFATDVLNIWGLADQGWADADLRAMIAPLVTFLPGATLTMAVIELSAAEMVAGAVPLGEIARLGP